MPRLRTFQDDEAFKKLLEANNLEDYYETYLQGKEVKDSCYSSVSEMIDILSEQDDDINQKDSLIDNLAEERDRLTDNYTNTIKSLATCKSIKEVRNILKDLQKDL